MPVSRVDKISSPDVVGNHPDTMLTIYPANPEKGAYYAASSEALPEETVLQKKWCSNNYREQPRYWGSYCQIVGTNMLAVA